MQTKLNFALTLVLKVRVFVTRKWPIGKTENTLGARWWQLSEYAEQVLSISFLTETQQTMRSPDVDENVLAFSLV